MGQKSTDTMRSVIISFSLDIVLHSFFFFFFIWYYKETEAAT